MDINIKQRVQKLVISIKSEFSRLNNILSTGLTMETIIRDDTLWVTIKSNTLSQSITVPLTHKTESGLELITNNDVTRVVCDYWLEREQIRLNYYDIIQILICDDISRIMINLYTPQPLISKIIRSFDKNMAPILCNTLQNLINKVVNEMPLHETNMNSWAMNHRLIIIDPTFDEIRDPNIKLEYQVEKNKKYYEKFGWTSIGLSDGVLADSNTILTTDLRRLTPFGMYHNPQRNLYSTLCMKGDELPRIRTASMQTLIDKNITRKGWNLTTAILDTPLNFEDQILVDRRHMGLSHKIEKRYIVYGDRIVVKKGNKINTGDVLGISNDGAVIIMRLDCDEAKVMDVKGTIMNVGGEAINAFIIRVEGKRYLKEGSKFSNLHGNKGIIKFANLGVAIEPRTGEEIPIDVMISAKSIEKRKNFGQVLEALINNVRQKEDHITMRDEAIVNINDIKKSLRRVGFPEDGVWHIDTYCGEFEAIVGKIFWGITKDPEDQLWHEGRTKSTDNREIRTSGLKFSHVEMKALVTHFGPNNPICNEILSYAQGVQNVKDEIRIIQSAKGDIDPKYPIISVEDIGFIDNSNGIFHTIDTIKDTIVDETFMPDGFVLKLPVSTQATVDNENEDDFTMSIPQKVKNDINTYVYDKIFIPNSMLRRCWHHPSGKWGLSVIGNLVNNIIKASKTYLLTNDVMDHINIIVAIDKYFRGVSRIMGSKTGELSTYSMGVRYPYSSRATVSLSDNLPENTIEIYEDMANDIEVKTGDVVLAERFPCLGFVSIRPQYVKVTKDPQCKYVIRVSGNSLISMTLDFDGDTLFIASFKKQKSIELLKNYMDSPNPLCDAEIKRINAYKMPGFIEMNLDDFSIRVFPKPTTGEHAELVRKATGVKSHTGPVIALAYNLMRIVEANVPYSNIKAHVELELLLDFLGNTVFKQKHGIQSLQEDATNAICIGDVNKMVELGFKREPSEMLCDLIRKEAASVGIRDLVWYHTKVVKERGGSKIVNRIVRMKNRLWFATRATMGPFKLLNHLEDKAVDLPSAMMRAILKSPYERATDILAKKEAVKDDFKAISRFSTQRYRDAVRQLCDLVDKLMIQGSSNPGSDAFRNIGVLE